MLRNYWTLGDVGHSVMEYVILNVTDLVNRGISIVRKMYAAYIIKLSINKNPKLKKRKEKDR